MCRWKKSCKWLCRLHYQNLENLKRTLPESCQTDARQEYQKASRWNKASNNTKNLFYICLTKSTALTISCNKKTNCVMDASSPTNNQRAMIMLNSSSFLNSTLI